MTDEGFAAVDSEIALTALLVTGVTAYPIPTISFYPLVKLTAFSLLVLTLMRRMAIFHDLSEDHQLLRVSTYFMDPATYISLLYLIYVFVKFITSISGMTEFLPSLFAVLTLFILFGLFLAWELAFRGPLREGRRIFHVFARKHNGEFSGIVLRGMANYIDSRQLEDNDWTQQASLADFRKGKQDVADFTPEELMNIGQSFLVFVISVLLPLVAYFFLIWASGLFSNGWWVARILLLFSTLTVSAFIRLWYSNYGLVKVEGRDGYLTFFGEAVTYLLFSSIVF